MLKDIGRRIREFFARVLRLAPPAPGHFVKDAATAPLRGWLRAAPWLWPSREYLLYVPRGYGRWRRRPLLVLIHGCKQTPEDFAAATRITGLADERGWLVLLPRQTAKANPWACWNWFDAATSTGHGETAIVVAQIRAVRRKYRAHPRRIFVAGFSAGGALAAALAVRRPALFAGVFVHSGIACGAASGPATATKVMSRGADADPGKIGELARAQAGGAVRLPLVVLHGTVDSVVAEVNARDVARQFLALNGYSGAPVSAEELPPADAQSSESLPSGRTVTTAEYRNASGVVVRVVRVLGLDHAWSGGDPALPWNDPAPPDATTLLGDFFGNVAASR